MANKGNGLFLLLSWLPCLPFVKFEWQLFVCLFGQLSDLLFRKSKNKTEIDLKAKYLGSFNKHF